MGKRKGLRARAAKQAHLPLSRLRERVANAKGVSRERVTSTSKKPSPTRLRKGFGGHPLPQAGEGKDEGDRDNASRFVNNFYNLRHVCADKACKRNSRCMGDPDACLDRWRDIVPIRQRRFFQFFVTALKDGVSNAEAVRIANAKCEQFADLLAQEEEQQRTALRAKDEEVERRKKVESAAVEDSPLPAHSVRHPLPQAGEGKDREPRKRQILGPRVRVL